MSPLLLALVGGLAQADEGPVQASVHGERSCREYLPVRAFERTV